MDKTTNVYVSREFNCGKPELFQWLIDPVLLSSWFGPKTFKPGKIETNPKKGGFFKIELIKPDGSSFFVTGEYLEIQEYETLHFSFGYQGMKNPPPNSHISITLESIDPKTTRLSLVQKFEIVPPDMASRTTVWQNMLLKLSQRITNDRLL